MKYELVNFSEIDKYAIKSYCALHNVDESLNLGDITKVNKQDLPNFDLLVGGSPCQDFSTSGSKVGAVWTCNSCGHKYNPLEIQGNARKYCPKCKSEDIHKTRSSLIVELLNILEAKKPKVFIYENVKALVSSRCINLYNKFLNEVESLGYNTYWKLLDSKDFGIPQHRLRVILVCIRKDIDTGNFKLPIGSDKGVRIKDFLNPITNKENFINQINVDNFVETLKAVPNNTHMDIIQGYFTYSKSKKRHQSNTVYHINGIAPTIDTKSNTQPKFLLDEAGVRKIRRLVPEESWRCMGYSSENFSKVKALNFSNAQLYKMAGNSIVVDVVEAVFKELKLALPDVITDGITVLSTFSGLGAFEEALNKLE